MIVLPAVNVKLLGTTAFGLDGVFIVAAAPVSILPVPAALIVVIDEGRVKTTVWADVEVLMTYVSHRLLGTKEVSRERETD